MIFCGARAVGGLLTLFFLAFYFALMAIVWAIGTVVVLTGMIVLATIEYFTQDGRDIRASRGKKVPFSFKHPLKKSVLEYDMGEYTYTFKGNDIISTRKK